MNNFKYPTKKHFSAVSTVTAETFREFDTKDEALEYCEAFSSKENIAIHLFEEKLMIGTITPDGEWA